MRDPDFFYSSVKYDDMKRFENDTKNNNNNHNGHGSGNGGGFGGGIGGDVSRFRFLIQYLIHDMN